MKKIHSILDAEMLAKADPSQMAVGWLLREAGKRDEDRFRYAIEKFPPEERSAILKAV